MPFFQNHDSGHPPGPPPAVTNKWNNNLTQGVFMQNVEKKDITPAVSTVDNRTDSKFGGKRDTEAERSPDTKIDPNGTIKKDAPPNDGKSPEKKV